MEQNELDEQTMWRATCANVVKSTSTVRDCTVRPGTVCSSTETTGFAWSSATTTMGDSDPTVAR